MNIGIVGLGLIGGSMARSIKNRTEHTVWGEDRNPETLFAARMCGAIDGTLSSDNLSQCDLLLLALYPNAVIEWVNAHAADIPKSAVVIDLCGVKRVLVQALSPLAAQYGFTYIGGHPMAGRERSGFAASKDDLFVGMSMILTPEGKTDLSLLEKIQAFFLDIGFGHITFSTPEEHDRIIAYTSQLAHISSNAYVKSPTAGRQRGFSAGSFRDMTRVARLDETMWTELFLEDADFLTEELRLFIENLKEYLDALEQRDPVRLQDLLRDGREKKAVAGGN